MRGRAVRPSVDRDNPKIARSQESQMVPLFIAVLFAGLLVLDVLSITHGADSRDGFSDDRIR
jgi:hypothetical protein